MRREDLAHILRSAARITADGEILVIGSQAILGSFDEDQLPVEVWRSVEADVAFFNDPVDAKSDQVDGAIGEDSRFHSTYCFYGQGVSITTAVLPATWSAPSSSLDERRTSHSLAPLIDAGLVSCDEAVAAARENGRSWSEIGLVLGISRQTARERYGHHPIRTDCRTVGIWPR